MLLKSFKDLLPHLYILAIHYGGKALYQQCHLACFAVLSLS